jgi:serine/threonine-protein kinase HipA
MDRTIYVYADLPGANHFVGRLWTRARKGGEGASFEYDRQWLLHPGRFSLEPALALGAGQFHTIAGKAQFGSIGDSAPDRWGRTLMRLVERRRARGEKRAPRLLLESDYLLMVDDETRQGALRFAVTEGGEFLSRDAGARIPPLVELPRLLASAGRVVDDSETDDDLRLLLAPGSSLGGARPKASVRHHDGRLMIAKFPRRSDEIDAVRWEAVALQLASRAGVDTPRWKVEIAARKPVLLLDRFDRAAGRRVPFLSAMSMLGASDNETRSYLEIADAIRRYGAASARDLRQLWRRIVFNVMISNTDDHLRNHGFLYAGGAGWRLSPAYDLNPVPADLGPRVLATAIDAADATASIDLAMSVAEYFGLPVASARRAAGEVRRAVSQWRNFARQSGIKKTEQDRVASAFSS